MNRYTILILLLIMSAIICNQSFAQLYEDDGKLIFGGSLPALNNNATYINPSILGIGSEKAVKTLSLFQVGFDAHSNSMTRGELIRAAFSGGEFESESKSDILSHMVDENGNFSLYGNLNINWLSFSWSKPKFGGLSINIRDQITSNFNLQADLANALITGDNVENSNDSIKYSPENSELFYHHIREASISYGRQAYEGEDIKLFVGFNYRKLWGIGHFDSSVEDSLASGNSSFSDFYDINYGEADSLQSEVSNKLLDHAGEGSSMSFGLSLQWRDRLDVGISALNINQITWKDKVLTAENAELGELDSTDTGMESYQFSEEAGRIYDTFGFEEGEDNFTTKSNGKLRINATFRVDKKTQLFSDIVMPMKKEDRAVTPPNYIFGIDRMITSGLRFSTGLQYNESFGTRIPAGVALNMGKSLILSVTCGDVRTLLSQKDPYAALSFSLIGNLSKE